MKETHLLVIDDDMDVLHALKRLFINEPYSTKTAMEEQEALSILDQDNIKVIICDQRMPNFTGIEFFRKIKKTHPTIKRILITGYSDLTSTQDAINIGEVYRYIHKPWDPVELKVSVYQAIQHFDLEQERESFQSATEAKNRELEVLNKKLKSMYQLQKDFMITASQELTRPLAAIQSSTEDIFSSSEEQRANAVNRVKQNIDQLSCLVKDILDVSSVEVEQLGLDIQYHNINQLIQDTLESMEDNYHGTFNVQFHPTDASIPEVPVDEDKMKYVLENLISNAVKATSQGEIEVFCISHEGDNYIEVHVKNIGGGIQEEDFPKLFQRMYGNSHSFQNEKSYSNGSLSICKDILKQHGGRIWAESDQGSGSCFRFILPVHERRKD